MALVSPFSSPFVAPFPSVSAAAAFTPLTYSPSLWLANRTVGNLYQDAGTSTPVAADGDPIGRSSDVSGNNNHCTQVTTSGKPTYKTSIQNGLSVARADGGDLWATTSTITLSGDITIFWAGSLTALGQYILASADGTSSLRISAAGAMRFLSTSDTVVTTNSFSTGAFFIAAFRRSGSNVYGYKNGVDITTGTPTNANALVIKVILAGNSGAPSWTGDLGELLVFPSALSAGDMTSMWTYLNGLWAVY